MADVKPSELLEFVSGLTEVTPENCLEYDDLFYAMREWRIWQSARAYARLYFGPAAVSIHIELDSEYNDNTYDTVTRVTVRDAADDDLEPDLTAPGWDEYRKRFNMAPGDELSESDVEDWVRDRKDTILTPASDVDIDLTVVPLPHYMGRLFAR